MSEAESSTALAPINSGPRAIALRSIEEIDRFAALVYRSNLVPKAYRDKKSDVVGVVMFGLELGLNPMTALQNIAWVNGRPSVYGDLQLAIVQSSGLLESFTETAPDVVQDTGVGCCQLKRRGRPPIERKFSKA